jgi:integrase/recombinase XerD
MQKITLISHPVDEYMKVFFPFEEEEIHNLITQIKGGFWDNHEAAWVLPKKRKIIDRLLKKYASRVQIRFPIPAEEEELELTTAAENALKRMYNLLVELRYSQRTIENYTLYLRQFLSYHHPTAPADLYRNDVQDFIRHLVNEKSIATSTQNVVINALKFYFEQIEGRPKIMYRMHRPKREKPIPSVLSKEEVNQLIAAVKNLKHRCILLTIYSAGLRLEELINLKIEDVDSQRNCIHVREGKGRKDRTTLLSSRLLKELRHYYKEYKPHYWLFEGIAGKQYSKRSVQNIMSKALKRAKITKKASVHTLRHSFATHLLEQGVNLRYIQELLGHSSSKITEIYTHVATTKLHGIISPLDEIDEN